MTHKKILHKCKGCNQELVFRADQQYHSVACRYSRSHSEQELKETNEIKGDRWTVVLPKTRIHTLEQLVEFCEIDLSIWEVERFIANKWEMGSKDDKGESQVTPLYQIKAFLKKRVDVIAVKEEIKKLVELYDLAFPARWPIKPSQVKHAMLEINLTDHHFGKMAWGVETRGVNYDVKIATKLFHRALDTLLARSPFEHYEEIWFVVGNDLFNSDDVQGRTTGGTYVESDFRYEKTYVTVRTLMVEAVEKLRTRASKVKVIVIPGNHDRHNAWHLGDSLSLYFGQQKDVEVDNRPGPRKYHVYGNSLLGYTHGDKGKLNDLPMLMATEARELFGQTKYHEFHTGHIHKLKVDEIHGVRVRIMPSLGAADAWHAEQGFVGNLRSSEAFVWDKKEGLIGTVIYTDDDSLIEPASEVPSVV